MTVLPFSNADIERFNGEGFVMKRGYFDAEEATLLAQAIAADPSLHANAIALLDAAGGRTELALWNHPSDDVFGAVARSHRLVDAMERLLGGEVYHYHSKLSMKKPRTGGAWNWHQDYGYWYQNGCLFPDLATAMVAIDPATPANGCLQVLKGSHRLGRLDHHIIGGQTSADPERVEEALKRLEVIDCEMAPGDTLFFHCNTLHASGQNRSDQPRKALLCAYNAARNNPFKAHHHPFYTPLAKLPDGAVKDYGHRRRVAPRDYMRGSDDRTITALDEN